ncbi:hypothetical protein H2203_005832 [Taxawa tesnikishii (nom. ined.)]|nr:hypothetical protein H2203_005832 [Dothideales sp. JES 119]
MPPRRTRSSAAAAVADSEPQQLSSPPATPAPSTRRATRKAKQASSPKVKVKEEAPTTPANKRKRTRTATTVNDDAVLDELPHNLGTLPTPGDRDSNKRNRRPAKAEAAKADPAEVETLAEKAAQIASPGTDGDTPKRAAKTAKKAGYGLTPGQTPYPDWPHPTPEECHEVVRLLEKVHGKVPSVLDALIRTRLSAATTSLNSSRAFQGLVKTFGIIEEGIGKGSVDWNKSGGLADVKSRDIKSILQMVYEENQARSAELKVATSKDANDGPAGVENEPAKEKEDEIRRADSDVLSLDHLHLLSNEEAFNKLVAYPGIGPKTASCVLLFCLQRPSFAVDTHVFRLCRYLGWVPPPSALKKGQPKVERNTTYSHCEVRIPDELKYALHQLLIKHGKACPRCRAATGMGSEKWDEGCPIEHLVKRYGAKKAGLGASPAALKKRTPKKKKKGKRAESEEEEEEEESSELSELSDSEHDDE